MWASTLVLNQSNLPIVSHHFFFFAIVKLKSEQTVAFINNSLNVCVCVCQYFSRETDLQRGNLLKAEIFPTLFNHSLLICPICGAVIRRYV